MRQPLLVLWLVMGVVKTLSAQKLEVDRYKITVVTKSGERIRGILDDVTTIAIYCNAGPLDNLADSEQVIPLETIHKVILRRTNKRLAIRAGAAIGGIVFGLFTVQGLKNNPTSNSTTYGITLLLGTGTGVAIGAGVGSILGSLSHRVVRPRDRENSLDDFRRQLEPFSLRYQNDVFKRVNQ